MKNKIREVVVAFFMIVGSFFLYVQTYKITPPRFEPLGSAFFPRMMLIAIIALSLIMIFQNLFKKESKAPEDRGAIFGLGEVKSEETASDIAKVLGTLIFSVVYALLIGLTDIHYLLLTFVFVFAFGWYLAAWETRVILHVLILAAAVTLVIYLVFGKFLKVFFP